MENSLSSLGRPINNRPQVTNLPHIWNYAVTGTGSTFRSIFFGLGAPVRPARYV
jgi:hypothetical protein